MIQCALLKYGCIAMVLHSLSGCGTIYLHSDARQKQGEDAAKAWLDVDLKSTFNTERDNLGKLLEAELQTQDRLALTVRNAELRKMIVRDGKLSLSKAISDRLEVLAGPIIAGNLAIRLTTWTNANTRLNSNARQQAEQRELQAVMGAPDVSCKELTTPTGVTEEWQAWASRYPEDGPSSRVIMNELSKLCKAVPELEKARDKALAALAGRIRSALEELAVVRAEIAVANATKTRVKTAVAAYKKALIDATGAADPKKATEKVAEAAKKLQDMLQVASQAQDAFSKELVSNERVKNIEKALGDIASNAAGTPPAGATSAVVAAVLLPQILDDAQAVARAGRVPATLPLVIRLSIERLRLDAATREVKSLQSQEELSQEIVNALTAQAFQLEEALRHLDNSPAKNIAQLPFPQAIAKAQDASSKVPTVNTGKSGDSKLLAADLKEALYRSTTKYLDAIGRLDARYYRLEYMRIAAVHEQSLLRSEVNVAQWEALIDSTVKQAAQHAAGGLKASDLTGLISALGIVWIGHGTNK